MVETQPDSGALPAVAIASLVGPSLRLLTSDRRFLLGLIAVFIFAPCVALFVHELGHVLAGWLVGFRFQLFVIGPLRLERGDSGSVRLRLNRDPALFGGVASSLPTDNREVIRKFALIRGRRPGDEPGIRGLDAVAIGTRTELVSASSRGSH